MKKIFCIALSAILIALFSCVFACSCKGESANACTYDIECKLEGSTVVGQERVEFYNFTDNAFTEIKFNLYGNALSTVYSWQFACLYYLCAVREHSLYLM